MALAALKFCGVYNRPIVSGLISPVQRSCVEFLGCLETQANILNVRSNVQYGLELLSTRGYQIIVNLTQRIMQLKTSLQIKLIIFASFI